jgi:hypothetical protein
LKVTTPPLATAATTASDVQLAGVPLPTTVVGCATLLACPSAGTAQAPAELPATGLLSAGAGGGGEEPGAGAGDDTGSASVTAAPFESEPPPHAARAAVKKKRPTTLRQGLRAAGASVSMFDECMARRLIG